MSGKTIVPFVTHGGGGLAKCAKDMEALCPGASMLKPFVCGGRADQAQITIWLRENGITV